MGDLNRRQTHQIDSLSNEEKVSNDLWAIHGIEDVFYQRGIQVGLWSILGGVAVGVLLTQFSALVEQVQASRWYLILYFIASLFILVDGWVRISWGALVLKWPIYFPTILPGYLTQISQSIMCLLVTNPPGWFFAAGSMLFFELLHQRSFMVSGAWERFSPESVKEIKASLSIFFLFMLICFSASAFLFFYPSRIAEIIWGVIAIFCTITAMVMQHKGMERERNELNIP